MGKTVATWRNEDIILDAAFDPNGGRVPDLVEEKVRLRLIDSSVETLIDMAKSIRPHEDPQQ